jgi:DNA-binding XRE family transcriptional regulator
MRRKRTIAAICEQKVNHGCLKEIFTGHKLSKKDGLMVNLLELFGKRIRGLRRAKELTQEQLAEIAGISLQNMGEIERGKGNDLGHVENFPPPWMSLSAS